MKKNNRQELILASALMLLPVLYAIYFYQRLPENMAIHFDLSGRADAFLPKFLVVFIFPIIMMVLEAIIYWSTMFKDIVNSNFKQIIRWFIPFIFVLLYMATIYRSIDENFNIRKIVLIIVAFVLLIIGNYLPKKVQENRRPLNRKLAYLFVGIGFLLFVIAIFCL